MDYIVQLLWKISWQAALVAGVVWAISRLAGKAPAAWRHALWLIVLVKFFVPPFAYFPSGLAFWQSPAPVTMHAGPTTSIPAWTPSGADVSTRGGEVSSRGETAAVGGTRAGIPGAHDIIALTWLAGVFVMGMVLVARRVRQRRLLRGSSPVSEGLTNVLRDCASRLGVGRVPEIRLSESASTPMLVGFFRPTILLPPEIAESCSRTDLSAMLLHELAHIRRWDMVGVWLHQLAQVFFFFHPAVWLAGRELKREREPACDEMVLGTSAITRQEYAAGYVSALKLASGRFKTRPALAMAEPFEIERRRLDMILRGAMPRMSARWAGALLVVAAVGLPTFAGLSARGEDPRIEGVPTAEFIVAALKNQETACGPSLEVKYTCEWSKFENNQLEERDLTAYRYVTTPLCLHMSKAYYSRMTAETSYDRDYRESKELVMTNRDEKFGQESSELANCFLIQEFLETTLYPLHGSHGRSLSHAMKFGAVRPQMTDVDGHSCWCVEVPAYDEMIDKYLVFVDPTIGFNPRRIERYYENYLPPAITEFKEYVEVADGVWFPKEQVLNYESSSVPDIQFKLVNRVSEIRVGRDIAREELLVTFPSGTKVRAGGEEYTVP